MDTDKCLVAGVFSARCLEPGDTTAFSMIRLLVPQHSMITNPKSGSGKKKWQFEGFGYEVKDLPLADGIHLEFATVRFPAVLRLKLSLDFRGSQPRQVVTAFESV